MFIIYFLIAFLTVFLLCKKGAIWRHLLAAVLAVLLVAIPSFFSFVAATINVSAEEFEAIAGLWIVAGLGGVLLAPTLGMLRAWMSRRRCRRKAAAGQPA